MTVQLDCPNRRCTGQVTYEVEAGLEGDPSLPYGTRMVYEAYYESRTCGSVHRWSLQDSAAAEGAAVTAYGAS